MYYLKMFYMQGKITDSTDDNASGGKQKLSYRRQSIINN